MINQYQTVKLEWTVQHEKSEVPFTNFESALSYANGLASRGGWVKEIDPDKSQIRLVQESPVAWPEDQTEEISGQERRRRLVD